MLLVYPIFFQGLLDAKWFLGFLPSTVKFRFECCIPVCFVTKYRKHKFATVRNVTSSTGSFSRPKSFGSNMISYGYWILVST